ncbi:hypothetical protein [Pseudomonas alkylphenolica]|uniref:hypothetical protein n=1 Tax=Pseudomonas alkylphenolica TaxID=237609 RepID=UPI0018D91053|nr:hypothetical protein [Pseudomonas alkylphenolica]MBH3429733.1 hypothetical protein [Pseudomonas alkylphenolica]
MGSIHEQAMQYIYQQVLQRLFEHLSQAQKASLQLLIQRLIVAAGGVERINGVRLMFVCDGSQPCVQALACLRAAQLSIASRASGTFRLHVATAWQAGMSSTTQANIDSTFSTLFMHDDPRVELLVLDTGQLLSYDSRRPPSADQQLCERHEWLLDGHLSADAALSANFAGHGYLHMAELARQAMRWKGGVDAIITADPLADRKRYLAWSRRALRSAELEGVRPIHSCATTLFDGMGALHRRYTRLLLGQTFELPPVPDADDRPALRFIAIDDLVAEHGSRYCERLMAFLGYRFDEQSFFSAQAGTASPVLLAHLQGLHAEFVDNTTYRDGIEAFQQQARHVMQHQGIPEALQDPVLEHWQADVLEARRDQANEAALRAYGLSEAQLVCRLFRPFVKGGMNLEAFLRRCHPGMLVALPYLHKALRGQSAPEPVVQWLVDIGGLPLQMLQGLYSRTPPVAALLTRLHARGADLRYLQAGTTISRQHRGGRAGSL